MFLFFCCCFLGVNPSCHHTVSLKPLLEREHMICLLAHLQDNHSVTKTRTYVWMYDYIYVLFVGVHYTYTDVNALAQVIKSFLASQIWFQAVAGARTYGTDSPAITSQPR